MSDLPAPVAEAGLLFQRSAITTDAEAMRQISAWGHQQIDIAYPDDPIRAPLNLLRRKKAHMEWDKVIRTTGRDLRGTIASQLVRDLEFDITRRQDQIRAEDAESNRRQAITFDTEIRVKEAGVLAEMHHRIASDQMRLGHDLNEQAQDNASHRRITEQIQQMEVQITIMTSEAVIKTMGTSSAEKTLEAVRLVNAEIASIRHNPDLTEDDMHLQIKTLLETLPTILHGARSADV